MIEKLKLLDGLIEEAEKGEKELWKKLYNTDNPSGRSKIYNQIIGVLDVIIIINDKREEIGGRNQKNDNTVNNSQKI